MKSNPCIVEPGQCIEEDVRFRFPCNVVMVGSTVHKVAVVVAVEHECMGKERAQK